jgi:hypothetical protein
MAERRVSYQRQEQAAGSRAAGKRCLICNHTFWADPLVWLYTAEGAPPRYAHVHHGGDISPPEFAAPLATEGVS